MGANLGPRILVRETRRVEGDLTLRTEASSRVSYRVGLRHRCAGPHGAFAIRFFKLFSPRHSKHWAHHRLLPFTLSQCLDFSMSATSQMQE